MIVSFVLAGVAAGLAAICYAEMASSVPVSGSMYSYAYATLGEIVAMGVAACLLLEYGVSTAAVAVGWSSYLNEAIVNITGLHIPQAVLAAPWDKNPGIINLPAVVLVALCMLLLIRGASESAKVNAIMVVIKLTVLLMFVVIAFTAFDADHFANFAPFGVPGIATAAGTIFFSFIGLDAVSTAGDEVKDPQKTMPRALISALFIVITFYILVAVSAIGAQPWQDFEGQSEAGLSKILEDITGNPVWATILALGAVISDLLADSGDDVRPDPHPVRHGPRRHAAESVRAGRPPHPDPGPEYGDRCGDRVDHGRAGSAGLPDRRRLDRNADRVHRGLAGRDHPAVREPDLPRGFKVPGYPVTPVLSILICGYILFSLHRYTWVIFSGWVIAFLIFYLAYGRRHSVLGTGHPLPAEED